MASQPIENGEAEGPAPAGLAFPAGETVDAQVRRAQAGDEEAFDGLVRAFGGVVYNLAYRMTGNAADADDVAQEVFVKLYRSIRQYRWQAKFSTWLYALAANTCRSALRKLRRVAEAEPVSLNAEPADGRARPDPSDPGELPGQTLERKELRAQVEAAMAELPDEFRMVIVLRDLQGLAYEEIAAALACTVGTVKSRLARARQRVKEKLVRQGVVCAAIE